MRLVFSTVALHLRQLDLQYQKTTAASLQREEDREKILSCQNNEICDFSTYWVKDTHNVLSVMLSY